MIKLPISMTDYQNGHMAKYAAEWTNEIESTAHSLLPRVNAMLNDIGVNQVHITSGWRPLEVNKKAGGSPRSMHLRGGAIDLLDDKNQTLGSLIIINFRLLEKYGLWLEEIRTTRGKRTNWVHLDIAKRPPRIPQVFVP